jgi:outer membrane protein OmpA-like peptidoglycan-associated protein
MRVRGYQFALVAVTLSISASAGAQALSYTPSFDPEQFTASSDPDQIALTDGARTATRGSYMGTLVLNVAGPPLDICVRDTQSTGTDCQYSGDIVTTRFRADLAFLYGFGKLDVRAVLPMVLHQSTDFPAAMGESSLSTAGVGDPRFGARYQLLRSGDIALAGDLSFTIPTGGNDFIGNSGLLVDPRVLADWRHNGVAIGAAFGYRYRQDAARLANLYVDDELTWSVAGEYKVSSKLSAGLALYGRIGVMSPDPDPMMMSATAEGGKRPAELMASARYFLSDQIALDVGAGAGISSGYGTVPFRVLAGIQWMHRKAEVVSHDADRDGIADANDKCVHEPEDKDGFEDTDGCPELDNDGDGLVDASDKCPVEPEDKDAFQDADGCPDPDNDGDGIADATDKCPLAAEDRDSFQDDDGCPDEDNDADGIADATDKCPIEAEDKDGFQDDDGCPEPDNDGDGIADAQDKCPLEAEVFNGVDDADGCPDAGAAQATVTSSAVVISDKIFFDTNKARIKTRSYAVLDAVAGVLKAYSGLRVRVEGHTDDRGSADWNEKLSQQRAESVRTYLIGKGVEADRLEAKGFGTSRPLVEGKNEAARSQNRRVEFVIIDGPQGTSPAPAPTTPAPTTSAPTTPDPATPAPEKP